MGKGRGDERAPGGLSRRGVLLGAAWAAPVVLLATAAPAAAASGPAARPPAAPAFRGGVLHWNGANWGEGARATVFMDCSSMAAGSAYAPGEVRIVMTVPPGTGFATVALRDGDNGHAWLMTPADPVGAATVILMNAAPVHAQTWVVIGSFEVTTTGPGPLTVVAQPTGLAAPLAAGG